MGAAIGLGFVLALIVFLVLMFSQVDNDRLSFKGAFGFAGLSWLATIVFGTLLSMRHVGEAEYVGTLYASFQEGLIWNTSHIGIKTDIQSDPTIWFAVPDQAIFHQGRDLNGTKVRVRCELLQGYLPWIGDYKVVTSISQSG